MVRGSLAIALAATALAFAAATARAQTANVTVSPGAGGQFDTFTFSGTGFEPGAMLERAYYSPDNEQFTVVVSGPDAVLTADADGAWRVEIVPALDFTDPRPGQWIAGFCIVGTPACFTATIDILE